MTATQMLAAGSVNRSALGKALNWVYAGLPKHVAVPCLEAIRVTVGPAGVELTAFDYETVSVITLEVADPAPVEGDVLVPGKQLVDVIRGLPDRARVQVKLTVEPGRLRISSEGVDAAVSEVGGAADYPEYPDMPGVAGVFDADAFADATDRVARAAGTDDTLPALLCLNLVAGPDAMEIQATDRYRLATDSPPWLNKGVLAGPVLIRAALVTRFTRKATRDREAFVYLLAADEGSWVALTDGTVTLMTQPMDHSTFPDFRKIIREQSSITIRVDGPKLDAAAAAGAQMVKAHKSPLVELLATGAGLKVTVFTESGERLGDQVLAEAEIDGPEHPLPFNPKYLAAAVKGATGTVTISAEASWRPVQFTCDDLPGWIHVAVPLRRDEKPAFSKPAAPAAGTPDEAGADGPVNPDAAVATKGG